MELVVALSMGAFILVLFYMNLLATLCLLLDAELSKLQRSGQIVFTWLFPVIGSSLVLYLVSYHSPEVIRRVYIPWPFRGLLDNNPLRQSDSDVSHEEITGIHSSSPRNGENGGD